MNIKSIIGATCICLTVVSFNTNAALVALNGVNYEWLEVTETTGMSRVDVEQQLNDINSSLYGYQYASRQLLEDLFLSYVPWNGINGRYGDPALLTNSDAFYNDFGITDSADTGLITLSTTDGYTVQYNNRKSTWGFYGAEGECGIYTCRAFMDTYYFNDTPTYRVINASTGWDADAGNPWLLAETASSSTHGSFLVRVQVVPVPAAVWLFGSGLIGLIGMAKLKKA